MNNVMTVTGSSSVWSNSGDLFIGDDSEYAGHNSLIIANGGTVYDTGANLLGSVSSVLVIGEGSVWNNNGDLVLAAQYDTSVIIANGGVVYDNNGSLSFIGGGNTVLVTGTGSVWSNRNEISINGGGYDSLTVSNGGVVYSSSGEVAGVQGGNFALITGTGSVWNVSGLLEIDDAFGNSFIISDGGAVYSGSGETFQPTQVTGNGSVWSVNGGSLVIANDGLTISDGGVVFAGSVSIIAAEANNGTEVNVSGGGLYATNGLGTGGLAMSANQLILNGGTVTVDQFQMVTDDGFFTFGSGLLTSGGTVVSNNENFVVGDGTNGATFQLASGGTGVHSFANGLTISSNAFLTGCGTVEGSVVDNPGGTIVANCGGTLTFTGIVTNNGTMQALNGSVLEAYGLVVNNGVIDIHAGTTNFHGGFVNNGIVITTNNFPVITAIQAVGPDVKVSVHTDNGSTYLFEETTNLTAGTWTPIIEFYGTGGIINFIDPGAAALPQRFYRVGLIPSP
jgi:T5SS/PEP-CTERM-associated repeat protein